MSSFDTYRINAPMPLEDAKNTSAYYWRMVERDRVAKAGRNGVIFVDVRSEDITSSLGPHRTNSHDAVGDETGWMLHSAVVVPVPAGTTTTGVWDAGKGLIRVRSRASGTMIGIRTRRVTPNLLTGVGLASMTSWETVEVEHDDSAPEDRDTLIRPLQAYQSYDLLEIQIFYRALSAAAYGYLYALAVEWCPSLPGQLDAEAPYTYTSDVVMPTSKAYIDRVTLLADTPPAGSTGYTPSYLSPTDVWHYDGSGWLLLAAEWDGVTPGQTVVDLLAYDGLAGALASVGGTLYAWDGSAWDEQAAAVDLSDWANRPVGTARQIGYRNGAAYVWDSTCSEWIAQEAAAYTQTARYYLSGTETAADLTTAGWAVTTTGGAVVGTEMVSGVPWLALDSYISTADFQRAYIERSFTTPSTGAGCYMCGWVNLAEAIGEVRQNNCLPNFGNGSREYLLQSNKTVTTLNQHRLMWMSTTGGFVGTTLTATVYQQVGWLEVFVPPGNVGGYARVNGEPWSVVAPASVAASSSARFIRFGDWDAQFGSKSRTLLRDLNFLILAP